MKKRWVAAVLASAIAVVGCGTAGPSANRPVQENQGSAKTVVRAGARVALVLPEQIGVNPFFQQEDEGTKKAAQQYHLVEKTIQSTDSNAIQNNLEAVAAQNYDLIITSSFESVDALTSVAKQYPKKKFAIIDAEVDLPNVTSVLFKEQEGAFLLGAAAGLATKTNTVGMVVAENIPLLKKWTSGFQLGLHYTNPHAKFLVNYVGSFSDPNKAKQLAILQHSEGADFIAATAAVGNFGIFDAAKQLNFYTAGQDVDQTTIDPKHIVLSQLKGTDVAAYKIVQSFVQGKLKPGVIRYGLKDGGVGLTYVTKPSKSPLSPFIGTKTIQQLKQIRDKIIAGKLVVKDPLASK
ncbi:MAG: BMP family protein [Alicyclobacillaceae bacterium]|nr:BMP family protein [Alicyclobacillaceae bacterium]